MLKYLYHRQIKFSFGFNSDSHHHWNFFFYDIPVVSPASLHVLSLKRNVKLASILFRESALNFEISDLLH